eukprot:493192-Alexandrium_andersonii.AAC.1
MSVPSGACCAILSCAHIGSTLLETSAAGDALQHGGGARAHAEQSIGSAPPQPLPAQWGCEGSRKVRAQIRTFISSTLR